MSSGALSVLFEDARLIAVDKPAGIHTAPLANGGAPTLLDMILERYPEISGIPGIKEVEPGLLHRLDGETSGVVVAARTAEAFERMRLIFSGGDAVKHYVAVSFIRTVTRSLREGEVLGIRSRFRAFGPGRRMVKVVPLEETAAGARAADRIYETEARVEKVRGETAFLRVTIRTGFRHQIRAHLAYLGMPIAGDPLYGEPCKAGAPARMYLHAQCVEFPHPWSGQPLRITSPLPPEFEGFH